MTAYYRVMLGKKSKYADQAFKEKFIGVDFDLHLDLTADLPDDWRPFNKKYIPAWLEENPGKSKIAAGLACATLWMVSKGINIGDIVLCPDGVGNYQVGRVTGGYEYHPEGPLEHRRTVEWLAPVIQRSAMSEGLRNSTGSIGTVATISKHAIEIEGLIGVPTQSSGTITVTDPDVEDPSVFALEKHLEDFLVANWSNTILGSGYDIFEEEGEKVGQQYPTDTGYIDILAVSKDRNELLVLELKKGRASDVVVGQIQRYMGYVKDELAEPGQSVKGIIIALEDDVKLRRALSVTVGIDFYRYEVSFKLIKQ